MENKSKSTSKNAKRGKVFLVGAGPGDLGLVTLRAKACIEQADVIIYDHLASPEMLGWAPEDAEIIFACFTCKRCVFLRSIILLLFNKVIR